MGEDEDKSGIDLALEKFLSKNRKLKLKASDVIGSKEHNDKFVFVFGDGHKYEVPK